MTRVQHLELLPLHPLGLLTEEEMALVEAGAACDELLARELDEYQEVAALLALAAPPLTAPSSLRSRLESPPPASAAGLQFAEEEPGIFVHRASDQEWTATPFAGVWVKQVAVDEARAVATSLVRLDPGAEYPKHLHTQDEQCMVVSGEVWLGTVRLRAGDYSRAAAGSRHGRVYSEHGCTLFVTACIHDELG